MAEAVESCNFGSESFVFLYKSNKSLYGKQWIIYKFIWVSLVAEWKPMEYIFDGDSAGEGKYHLRVTDHVKFRISLSFPGSGDATLLQSHDVDKDNMFKDNYGPFYENLTFLCDFEHCSVGQSRFWTSSTAEIWSRRKFIWLGNGTLGCSSNELGISYTLRKYSQSNAVSALYASWTM